MQSSAIKTQVMRIPYASELVARSRQFVRGDVDLAKNDRIRAAVIRLKKMDAAGRAWRNKPNRLDRINEHMQACFTTAGVTGGDILEIGARHNPRTYMFPPDRWNYRVLDIEDFGGDVEVVIADITNCPEIPDNSYDAVVSVDVFEHVMEPWKAAEEITRILKPGGIVYTSTIFAWRYHPVPVDFWRYTPACLEFLFSDLETIDSGFDLTERRRDFRGRGRHDRVPIDAFGGFRENRRVHHAGRKPDAG